MTSLWNLVSPVSTPAVKMGIPVGKEAVPEQSATTSTTEAKTIAELTREKLERAPGKSGNPRRHDVDDALNALETRVGIFATVKNRRWLRL
jgi:hypothetical protein